MITPSFHSISAWVIRPSASVIRVRSRNPNAPASHSRAAAGSSYAMNGMIVGYSTGPFVAMWASSHLGTSPLKGID